MRPDGTPVYRFDHRAGAPTVSVSGFDPDTGGATPAATPVPASDPSPAPDPDPDHRHAHDFFVLLYLEEPAGPLQTQGGPPAVRSGQLHAVPPGTVVDASDLAEASRCRGSAIAFTADAVPALSPLSPLAWAHHPLFAMFSPGSGTAFVPDRDRARWSTWIGDLAEEITAPERLGTREAVSALLTRILVAAARLFPGEALTPDPLVERVFEEIEAHFRRPVTVTDVAESIGYTPGHLTTVVRERTGRPLLDWITERRMTEIRRLLRETDLPLGAIAAQTGLRDASYLVRRFRVLYGVTPQRWRRDQRA
ncbi:helix-turn-helix transcriptional regulator [Brachybacterium sp. GCM10030267]|uniref:helix-turn-helix transcriptional regulator n=1 Tax=Brachybacterium sp. GCM10030267 TaxID=3273381 RepID=UPI0036122D8D